MKKKYKGFTLIELLAVIIVLAVISIVAVPIVIDVIDDAKKEADLQTAYGIIDTAELFFAESILNDEKKSQLTTSEDNPINIYNQIEVNNDLPKDGKLYVNEEGKVALSVVINDRCYKKEYYEQLQVLENEECNLEYVGGMDTTAPTITFTPSIEKSASGWYTDDLSISINTEDLESKVDYIDYCIGNKCTPTDENRVHMATKSVSIEDSILTQVCVRATNKAGISSEVKCSDDIQKDTKGPTFKGLTAIQVEINGIIDLLKDVEIEDATSGVVSAIDFQIDKEVSSTSTINTKVKYTATDIAGKTTTEERTVIVSADAPYITFEEEDVINKYGWANKDFYVTINVKDNSGHGIKEFKVCTSTTGECDVETGATITGKTTGTRQIVTESASNRICVQAVDNYNQESAVICSETYKLDKTKPTAGTINIDGTLGLNDWYTSNISITAVDGSDSLSGHLETTVDTLSITEDTSNKIVTVTTTDIAGNESTRTYTFKLDKTKPVVDYTIKDIDGNNGWYKSEVTLKGIVTDKNYSKLRWCQGLSCTPTTEITDSEKTITLQNTKGTGLCIIGIDKAGNESEKVCSDVIKVDTVLPEFSGIGYIPVEKDAVVDLRDGVTVKDETSGIDGDFTITTEFGNESIDTSKTGEYEAKYTVYDKAGNKQEITRKVIVSADAPEITFEVEEGALNEYGWAKKDFYVTINVKDNSGHGIKEFKVCTATTDTCDVEKGSTTTDKTTESRQIVQESSNNRICVQATDKYNQTSAVVCSDAYKLDKTKPSVGSIDVTGTLGENGWYTSNVTVSKVDGSDTLSGHLSTTIDKNTITTNTKGENVLVTTKDKAYNEITKDFEIKIDKTKPTCSISTLNYIGVGKTATVNLTCTNEISGIKEVALQPADFTVSNAKVTNVVKASVTNGYKYTVTLEGTSSGTFNITLPAGKIKTNAGLTNDVISSNAITVTSLSINPNSGVLYVDGSNITATVVSDNAGQLSCLSNNTSIATCSISGTTLTVSPKAAGSTTITVTGANGSATATYAATVKTVSLSINPTSGTLYVGGSNKTATISGSNYGELSCTSGDNSVATCSISGTTLTISPKAAGTVTITVNEKNANKKVTYTASVLQPTFTLSETSGTLYVNGSNKTVTITGENYGTLSCRSDEPTIATCTVSQTGLTVIPKGVGTTTITVEESNGKVTKPYTATVVQPTLTLSETSGVIYNGGNSKKVTIGGTNYGELSCTSGSDSIATCSISGTTLTINPKSTAGDTTITVSESNGNVSTTYSVTNKIPTITLNSTSGTTYVGGKDLTATITTTDGGSLSCESSNKNVATCVISGNTVVMTPGTTSGSAVITVTESNGNKTAKYTFNNRDAKFDINVTYKPEDSVKYYANDSIRYWSNKDYYVNVEAKADFTISKIEMCTATTNTCDPTGKSSANGTTGAMLVAQESNNNRVCVIAYDEIGRASAPNCSEAFGLDKANPTAGTIKVNGSNPSTNWYNAALTITKVDGSDSLSGHLSTTVDTSSITSSTEGKTVKVTTTDKAGNTSTRTYTLKTDLTVPEVTIAKSSGSTKLTATVTPSTTISNYTYQWYKNGTAISGATTLTYTPTSSGKYTIKVTTTAGKATTSNEVTINGYTVTYDLNGGTESIESQTKVQDISLTLSSNVPTKEGYTFQGWGSSAGDTSVDYAKGATYTGNANITLYAIWKKTVTITFVSNGATIDKTSATCDMYNADASCKVTFPTITRSGFTIIGFNTSSSATTSQVSSGAETSVSSNAAYYAITKKDVIATFVANNATLVDTSNTDSATKDSCTIWNAETSCTVYSPNITAPSATPTVVGFHTSSTGSTNAWSVNSAKSISNDVTYYAITKKDAVTYTATFVANNATLVDTTNTDSNTKDSCTIAATYNGTAQTTSCTVYSPNITAPSATPTVVGFHTSSTGSTNAWSVNSAKSISSNVTYYAITKKDAVTYNITYAKGTGVSSIGATNGSCNISATYNGTQQSTTCSITLPTITASTGYTVSGWYNASGTKLGNASVAISVSSSQTITAKATVNSYACSAGYYLGASATSCTKCEAGSYCSGGTYNYSSSVQGKSTCPSGYGSSAAGSSAASQCYKTITVTYSGNGNTGGSTSTSSCNAYYNNGSCSITLRANGFTKTNYTFQGWGTGTSSVTHNASSSYSFSSNTTLYAIWKSTAICRRATSLHTETCNRDDENGCVGSYMRGSISSMRITYGSTGTTGILKSGDAFDCDVNGDGTYDAATERFYYVSDLYNTTSKTFDSNYAVLIYYTNTADSTQYYDSDSSYRNAVGPRTAMTYLPTSSQWKKASLSKTTRAILNQLSTTTTGGGSLPSAFSYEGYSARLLTTQELKSGCPTTDLGTWTEGGMEKCLYLMERTNYASHNYSGYWLETPYSSNGETAYYVDASTPMITHGYVNYYISGVRPVIEVKKTDMSY